MIAHHHALRGHNPGDRRRRTAALDGVSRGVARVHTSTTLKFMMKVGGHRIRTIIRVLIGHTGRQDGQGARIAPHKSRWGSSVKATGPPLTAA